MNILKTLFEFVVIYVIVKGIIARWLANIILQWITKESVRNLAIWQHWMGWARNHGHVSNSVLSCSDGHCATF